MYYVAGIATLKEDNFLFQWSEAYPEFEFLLSMQCIISFVKVQLCLWMLRKRMDWTGKSAHIANEKGYTKLKKKKKEWRKKSLNLLSLFLFSVIKTNLKVGLNEEWHLLI